MKKRKKIIPKYPGGGPANDPNNHPAEGGPNYDPWYGNTGSDPLDPTPTPVNTWGLPDEVKGAIPWDAIAPIFSQLLEGEMGMRNMKQNDVFHPIQGFRGFNYQSGGNVNRTGYTPGFKSFQNKYNIIPSGNITMANTPFPIMGKSLETGETKLMQPGGKYNFKNTKNVLEVPQYQDGGEVPNNFNNQDEEPFNLKGFLPFVLDDPRNTLNAGDRKLIEIQTEKGEYVSSPLGDLVKVAAKKKHKNMEANEATDITAEGNYVFSNDKNMVIKDQKVGSLKLEDIIMGREPIYYKEGEIAKTPEEYTLGDVLPDKKKFTFAEGAKSIADEFPLTTRAGDPFAIRAQVENKLSRKPYIEKLIQLSEMKRPTSMSNPNSKFRKGGFASIGSIYRPLLNQLNRQEFGAPIEDPLLANIKNKDNALKGIYQQGGYTYDDRNKGQNKREQWNYWLNQAQTNYNDYTNNKVIPSLQGQAGVNLLGVLGQNAYQGDNQFLNGNDYLSQLDTLQNQQDRSFNSEQAYYENGQAGANTAIRLGANAGYQPSDLVGMRSNAVNQQNAGIANLGSQRRAMTDKYGSMRLNATDMFAGRNNAQKSYLNDFSNNQIQNVAGIGSNYLAQKTQAQGAGLDAVTKLQLAKQAGNGWTDFTNGLGDFINAVTGIAGAITGVGGTKFNQGGNNQPNASWNGQNSFMGNYGYDPNSPWPQWNPNGMNGFNQPLNTNTNATWGFNG